MSRFVASLEPLESRRLLATASVGGTWSATETLTITATVDGESDTQTVKGSGPVTLVQSGTHVYYDRKIPGTSTVSRLDGSINGNTITLSGKFLVFPTAVSVTENTVTVTGTLSGNTLHLMGTGRASGSIQGQRFTATGKSDAVLTRSGAPAGKGIIKGKAFIDADADGVRDATEIGGSGFTIFLDTNRNGVLDTGEKSSASDSSGNFSFTGLSAGSYRVAVAARSGWRVTIPVARYKDLTLAANATSTTDFGNYNDPDDQIAEAINLQQLTAVRTAKGTLSDGYDVDMYRFEVQAGQTVAFDLDATKGKTFASALRLFDANGAAMQSGAFGEPSSAGVQTSVLRETLSADGTAAYLEYTFAKGGVFHLGVSGAHSKGYDAKTGNGDVAGAAAGAYTLEVTPVTYNTGKTSGVKTVGGILRLPNRKAHVAQVATSIVSVDTAQQFSRTIQTNPSETWVIVHGRVEGQEKGINGIKSLGAAIASKRPNAQVLLVDWSPGAADNTLTSLLRGAGWISAVGNWVSSVLMLNGTSRSRVHLVGHSWGSYVAYEIAASGTNVHSIVALDPAYKGDEYPYMTVNFSAFSTWSWAFFGGGIYGNTLLAGSADEAFDLTYTGAPSTLEAHTAPVRLFESLVRGTFATGMSASSKAAIQKHFALDRLISASKGPWSLNRYSQGNALQVAAKVYEGRFSMTRIGGAYGPPSVFRYFGSAGTEVVLS